MFFLSAFTVALGLCAFKIRQLKINVLFKEWGFDKPTAKY